VDSFELLVGQWLSVGFCSGLERWSTLRRRPQSMRRISTASAQRGPPVRRSSKSQSVASWSWYSSSQVDLMLMSRKRANSFELVEPQPSTILKAIDSAALVICDLSEPRSLRGNVRIARRTPSTSPCALCHTNNRRKSCIQTFSPRFGQERRQFSAPLLKSKLFPPLTTTNNCLTNQLTTHNLHPLSPTSNSPARGSTWMQ